jgi:hypothetical protein
VGAQRAPVHAAAAGLAGPGHAQKRGRIICFRCCLPSFCYCSAHMCSTAASAAMAFVWCLLCLVLCTGSAPEALSPDPGNPPAALISTANDSSVLTYCLATACPVPRAPCPVPRAPCPVPRAPCPVPRAPCPVRPPLAHAVGFPYCSVPPRHWDRGGDVCSKCALAARLGLRATACHENTHPTAGLVGRGVAAAVTLASAISSWRAADQRLMSALSHAMHLTICACYCLLYVLMPHAAASSETC